MRASDIEVCNFTITQNISHKNSRIFFCVYRKTTIEKKIPAVTELVQKLFFFKG